MKKLYKLSFIIGLLCSSVILASCSSGSSNNSNSSNLAALNVVMPAVYPSTITSTAYLTITNTSNVTATNLVYSIPSNDQTGNTTGVTPVANNDCSTIIANATCILGVEIPAGSTPGAFSISISGDNLGNVNKLYTSNLNNESIVATNVGISYVPTNNYQVYVLPTNLTLNENNQDQTVLVSVLIESTNVESVNFVTQNSISLNSSLISQAPSGNFGNESVATYAIVIPSTLHGSLEIQALTNSCLSDCSNTTSINFVESNVGILNINPSTTNMSLSYESQIYTLTNNGIATITDITLSTNLPSEFSITKNTCTSSNEGSGNGTLVVGASCNYQINYAPDSISGNESFAISYNNGSRMESTYYTINYTGITPGITVTTQRFPSNDQLMRGESFNIIATLSGNDVTNQTITISNMSDLESSGITVSSNPSSCILQTITTPFVESCNFTVTANWSAQSQGPVTVMLANSGSVALSESQIQFNVIIPNVYLPKTGESLGTPGCNNTMGADCVLQTGVQSPNPRFIVNSNLGCVTITDELTGLTWQGAPESSLMNFSEALSYVNNNQGTCSISGWRLPNVNELKSLMNFGASDQVTWLTSQGFSNLSTAALPDYWTSSVIAASIVGVNYWVVSFVDGSTGFQESLAGEIGRTSRVIMVSGTSGGALADIPRTGESANIPNCNSVAGTDCVLQKGVVWPNPRFILDPTESCITDNLTGLMWVQNLNTTWTSLPWNEAIMAVGNLNAEAYCGYTDWRLPNINELSSLINYGESDPSAWLNNNGFSNVSSSGYWTSSVNAAYLGNAWLVGFGMGLAVSLSQSENLGVWPVRGGTSN